METSHLLLIPKFIQHLFTFYINNIYSTMEVFVVCWSKIYTSVESVLKPSCFVHRQRRYRPQFYNDLCNVWVSMSALSMFSVFISCLTKFLSLLTWVITSTNLKSHIWNQLKGHLNCRNFLSLHNSSSSSLITVKV